MQLGTSFSPTAHGSHSESDASSTPVLSVFSGSLLCVASSEASDESCEGTGLSEASEESCEGTGSSEASEESCEGTGSSEASEESCEERESSEREVKKASKELPARLGIE